MLLVVTLLLAFVPQSAPPPPSDSLPAGELGRPLGTVVTISGIRVDDDARRLRSDMGKTLLRVDTVDGKALAKPMIVVLRGVKSAAALGTSVTVVGFETGGFTGLPEEAFKYIPRVATTGFHFERWFHAIKDVSPRR